MRVKVIIEIFLEIIYPTNIHPQQQYNRYGNTNQYNIHEHNQRPCERERHRDHSVNPSNTNQHRNQLENLFNGLFSNFGLNFPSNNISVILHGGLHGSSP